MSSRSPRLNKSLRNEMIITTLERVPDKEIIEESILERGRREAVLRMKEQAIVWGATQVVNVRLETASIGNQASGGKGLLAVEVIAYGTGIR